MKTEKEARLFDPCLKTRKSRHKKACTSCTSCAAFLGLIILQDTATREEVGGTLTSPSSACAGSLNAPSLFRRLTLQALLFQTRVATASSVRIIRQALASLTVTCKETLTTSVIRHARCVYRIGLATKQKAAATLSGPCLCGRRVTRIGCVEKLPHRRLCGAVRRASYTPYSCKSLSCSERDAQPPCASSVG